MDKDRILEFYFSNPIYLGLEIEFYSKDLPFINSEKFKIVKESGYNQYELVSVIYDDIDELIKDVCIVKETLVAQHANFDAVLDSESPSSGMHINFSFQDKVFFSNNIENIIGGLMEYSKEYAYIFAPTILDQSRYLFIKDSIHDIHTPKTLSWGYNNRSVAFRVVKKFNGDIERVENRLPSSSADIKSCVYANLECIRKGLINRINPIDPTYGIASDLQYKNIMLSDLYS